MTAYISQKLRNRLEEVDNAHCAYCWTTQANSGQPMTIVPARQRWVGVGWHPPV